MWNLVQEALLQANTAVQICDFDNRMKTTEIYNNCLVLHSSLFNFLVIFKMKDLLCCNYFLAFLLLSYCLSLKIDLFLVNFSCPCRNVLYSRLNSRKWCNTKHSGHSLWAVRTCSLLASFVFCCGLVFRSPS